MAYIDRETAANAAARAQALLDKADEISDEGLVLLIKQRHICPETLRGLADLEERRRAELETTTVRWALGHLKRYMLENFDTPEAAGTALGRVLRDPDAKATRTMLIWAVEEATGLYLIDEGE